jgi:putative ABC transport system permease protein
MGMTSGQIRLSLSLGVVGLGLIGTLAGAVLGTYLIPRIFEHSLENYGIIEVPLQINRAGVILLAFCCVPGVFIGSWRASRSLSSASPRTILATE